MTFRTGGIQKKIFLGIRLSFRKSAGGPGDISPFRALMTSLASTIGTGNIVGVGTAIALGGPGAVFWMWISGVLGIATKYGESLMAVRYRVRTETGRMAGGAMYVLSRRLRCPWGGALFAFFTALAALGMGSMVQSNSIASLGQTNLQIAPWITGSVVCVLAYLVLAGGVQSIARVCSVLIPAMALFFFVGNLLVLWLTREFWGDALLLILQSAFSPQSAAGGAAGYTLRSAMQYGISRGLFSNESGMGSAPIAAAAAKNTDPVRQALIASTGTFWDTVVLCALTGLALVSAMLAEPSVFADGSLDGGLLTSRAFGLLGDFGPVFLTVSLTAFAFSTIVGWYYYGERAVEYLLGRKAFGPYRLLYIGAALGGSVLSSDVIWQLGDISNGLMAIPNLAALWILSDEIGDQTRRWKPSEVGKSLAKG
ncbi:MAG: alanine:cation symporter family protein [Firmicutes bacterium]|nr:alanine:cation symporter family protein [Bacillota bacterium]